MRNQYITKTLVEKRMAELKAICSGMETQGFLDERERMIKETQTKEARKYLFFETILAINNPSRWKIHLK